MNKLNNAMLRVKQKSLAAEATIIRREEKGMETVYGFNPIYDHRIKNVRWESRATHLARAFIKGVNYSVIEKSRKPEKEYDFNTRILPRVKKLVKKYGKVEFDETWLNS